MEADAVAKRTAVSVAKTAAKKATAAPTSKAAK
jgi:hypothetical protein